MKHRIEKACYLFFTVVFLFLSSGCAHLAPVPQVTEGPRSKITFEIYDDIYKAERRLGLQLMFLEQLDLTFLVCRENQSKVLLRSKDADYIQVKPEQSVAFVIRSTGLIRPTVYGNMAVPIVHSMGILHVNEGFDYKLIILKKAKSFKFLVYEIDKATQKETRIESEIYADLIKGDKAHKKLCKVCCSDE